jgi:DNA polymerase III epsilon subunit family exonuclease
MMLSRQVMVVADPNQAIYGWRDANAGRMLGEYRRLYQPQIFKMAENYRSAGNLVRAAQHLISGSGADASVVPVHPDDLSIDVVTCVDAIAEAEWLAKQIKRARQSGRYSYGDIALLYRANWRADLLEATLLREGVPLRREQENRFFNNLDVQATLRYLSLIQALSDEQFESALHWPRVLVDEVTMTQLQRLARAEGISLSSLARRIDDYASKVSPLTRALIRDFVSIFDVELAQTANQPIVEIVQPLLSVLKQRRSPITYSVRENLKGILESLTGPLQPAVDRLAQAIATQRSVKLLHNGTIDSVAGAFIIKHILEHYFQYPVEIQPQGQPISAGTFVITFGIPRSADEQGFGLGVYESRLKTLIYSMSTQAWRIGQMLLMRYETQKNSQFVLFDLETTGTHIRTTEILEMAALEVVGSVETERTFNALARPNGRISSEVSQVHGITEELVKDQPTIDVILPGYLDFLGNATLVGHNVEAFDYPVLHRVANSLTLVPPIGPMIDTCKLARRLLPDNSHRLEALAQMFGYQEAQTHRALDDVRLNAKVFFRLLDLLDREREIDIASEVLPLVALGIRASNVPLTDYNLWIAQAGARAVASGLGQSLCQQLTDVVDDIWELDDHEGWLAELPHADAEEDRRWNELTQRWQDALTLYQRTFDDQSLGAFLHYVRLASSIDYHDDDDDRVTLMTIHSAKGKEWPLVFVVGVEDGTIPSFLAKTRDEIEEERRVMYVAITRAKKRLCVTQVQSWSGYKKVPSRFLHDIPDSLITKRTIAVGQSR